MKELYWIPVSDIADPHELARRLNEKEATVPESMRRVWRVVYPFGPYQQMVNHYRPPAYQQFGSGA